MNGDTLLEMLTQRSAALLRQSEVAMEMKAIGEGSSTSMELDRLEDEMVFLTSLGRTILTERRADLTALQNELHMARQPVVTGAGQTSHR